MTQASVSRLVITLPNGSTLVRPLAQGQTIVGEAEGADIEIAPRFAWDGTAVFRVENGHVAVRRGSSSARLLLRVGEDPVLLPRRAELFLGECIIVLEVKDAKDAP